jgi:hypothetical protein
MEFAWWSWQGLWASGLHSRSGFQGARARGSGKLENLVRIATPEALGKEGTTVASNRVYQSGRLHTG